MKFAIVLILSALLAACGAASHTRYVNTGGNGNLGGGGGSEGDHGRVPEPVKTPAFAKVTEIFAANRCLVCHSNTGGNRGGINLETYASVFPIASDVVDSVVKNRMPRGGPAVSDPDKALLTAWVEGGAPEFEAPEVEPPITFAEMNSKLFTPKCIGCHSGFNTHQGVTGRLSAIQQAIDTDRMPQGGPPVAPEIKILLAKWIAQGAPL